MLIAQISDLHIGLPGRLAYGCIDAAARFARCRDHILGLRPLPDMVVASGDLVDAGDSAEYARLRELLAPLPMPVYLMPGNHDDHNALRAGFADHHYFPLQGKLHYVLERQPVRLVMLDTVIPGSDGGALGSQQLEWLAMTLESEPRKPTLVFMHHPPIATGIRHMDRIALADGDCARLGAVIGRHQQVERIACGHLHRCVETRWCGTVVGVCPSAAFQSAHSLEKDGFEPSPDEPPAYQLHYWNQAQLVTHTLQVTD